MTRAKFVCYSEKIRQTCREFIFMPVAGGSDENKEFWKYTPSGEIKINLSNEANTRFEVGKSYYVDFTEAN